MKLREEDLGIQVEVKRENTREIETGKHSREEQGEEMSAAPLGKVFFYRFRQLKMIPSKVENQSLFHLSPSLPV